MALTVDGDDGTTPVYVRSVSTTLNLAGASQPFTFGAWVYPTGGAADISAMRLEGYPTPTGALGVNPGPSSGWQLLVWDGTEWPPSIESSGGTFTANAWTALVAAGEGTGASDTWRLFQDGSQIVSGTTAAGFSAFNIDDYGLGAHWNELSNLWGEGFNGRVAEFFIAHSEWSVDQAAAFAQGFSPLQIDPDNIQVYLPLFGANFTEDWSGNQNDASLINSPSAADHAPIAPPGLWGVGNMAVMGAVRAAHRGHAFFR